MGLKLCEVKEDHEFEPLMVAFRKGFMDPGNTIWALFTAELKPYNDAQTRAVLKECAQRFSEWHRHDPTSTWLQVIDEETGEIAAGGRWSIFKREDGNPYDVPHQFEATWFPEGDLRTIATHLLNEFLASANKDANYPHVFLNIIFTVPEYRRKGASSMIMEWGVAQAKKYDLPMFIEATPEGRPLYYNYGLHAVGGKAARVNSDLQPLMDKDEKLRETVNSNLLPLGWTSMAKGARQ